jgi:hypothetical protein
MGGLTFSFSHVFLRLEINRRLIAEVIKWHDDFIKCLNGANFSQFNFTSILDIRGKFPNKGQIIDGNFRQQEVGGKISC